MIKEAIEKLAEGIDLSEKEAKNVMLQIMQGDASDAQIAAYLMGLRTKGESVDEISGSVKAMRSMAQRVSVSDPMVVDTCGTGGDGSNTFNISTAAAFVIAGGEMTVAKHGNRSVSSRSGSADVLSALGAFNDKALRISKVFGAAQALISTFQGSAEALKLPFPANLVAAATVAAKGLSLVAAIKGVSKGGGGGGGAAVGGGAAASSVPPPQPVERRYAEFKFLGGNVYEPRALVDAINNATDQGLQIKAILT